MGAAGVVMPVDVERRRGRSSAWATLEGAEITAAWAWSLATVVGSLSAPHRISTGGSWVPCPRGPLST